MKLNFLDLFSVFFACLILCSCSKKQENEIHPEVQSLLDQSIAFLDSNPDSSFYFAERLLEVATKKDDGFGMAQSHFIMGYLLQMLDDINPSVIHYLKALEAADKYKFSKRTFFLCGVYLNIGDIFRNYNADDLAFEFNYKGLELALTEELINYRISFEYNLAIQYFEKGNFHKALSLLKNQIGALELGSAKETQRFNLIQKCYLRLSMLDSAKMISREILNREYNQFYGSGALFYAHAHKAANNNDSADWYFNQAIKFYLYHSKLDVLGYTAAAIDYSKLCIELGALEKAESILIDASKISDTTNANLKTVENFFEIYDLLSDLNKSKGDYENAVYYENLYRKELKAYTQLHQKYDFNKIVDDFYANLEEEKRTKEIKQYAYIGSISLLLILGGVFGTTQYKSYRTRKKLEESTTEKRLAELKALKAQINPHFLFNALNSIQSYILEDQHDVAEGYLVKYGKLMRKILDHSDELTVPLNDELEALQLYVELEQIRVNGGFSYEVHVDEAIDVYSTYVPSMVIQPILENAIWHGVSKLNGEGKSELSFDQKGGWIEIVIKDNGPGFDAENMTKSSSKGVRLVRERLELLGKTQGLESVLEVKSEMGNGTMVILKISNELV